MRALLILFLLLLVQSGLLFFVLAVASGGGFGVEPGYVTARSERSGLVHRPGRPRSIPTNLDPGRVCVSDCANTQRTS